MSEATSAGGSGSQSGDRTQRFFDALMTADIETLRREFSEIGVDINIRQPETEYTALHIAAGLSARPIIRWLLEFPELNFLARDSKGRLPSAIAYEVADDRVVGRYLVKRENRQAREQGADIRTLLIAKPDAD